MHPSVMELKNGRAKYYMLICDGTIVLILKIFNEIVKMRFLAYYCTNIIREIYKINNLHKFDHVRMPSAPFKRKNE